MTDWPKLMVMLLTYSDTPDGPRAMYARETLRSTLEKLRYSGQISVHIADDGSPEAHRSTLYDIAGGFENVHGITWTDAKRSGYGASYNLATQVVHAHVGQDGIVLPLEDDWRLAHEMDVDGYVQALISSQLDCVRLGYLGFTQELRGWLIQGSTTAFLKFDPTSAEPHISAGHPRLETARHQHWIGPWDEGVDPGTTEIMWCSRYEARQDVGWPMDTPRGGWFHHIGSVQARSDQV